jgi:fused signal recognition particle receptor
VDDQTAQLNYIEQFGREWSTIATFLGPPLTVLIIVIVIYFLRRRHLKEVETQLKTSPTDSSGNSVPAAESSPLDLEPDESDFDLEVVAETIEVKEDSGKSESVQISWMERLRNGLSRTRSQLSSSISNLFVGQTKIDAQLLDQIHEALFKADLGVKTADLLIGQLRNQIAAEKEVNFSLVSEILKKEIANIFNSANRAEVMPSEGPRVILIIGVNGVGKTTTVGKLAAWHIKENRSVLLCAADTFRAAAIEQLSIWADRIGVPLVAHKQGADPAAVAFDGVKAGKARGVDTVIIDTAGRLHNKAELMAELGKVTKVIQKEMPEAPHETWIVVDATTGQNAVQQVKAFLEVTTITGVIVTKLDGSAKGGIVTAIAQQFNLPIRYIGVGETTEDLRPFNAEEFTASLF